MRLVATGVGTAVDTGAAGLDLTGEQTEPSDDSTFDDLARAAAALLDAPLAFFTAVDAEQAWYSAVAGLPADAEGVVEVEDTLGRDIASSGGAVVVSDALTDAHPHAHPVVASVGALAWAGIPVRDAAGGVLGSFCVVDVVAREWSTAQIEALQVLAQAAADHVQLRQALRAERHARADAERAWVEAETARVDLQHARAREHRMIEVIQRSLLPQSLPEVPGLITAVRFEASNDAADIGGDWYDVIHHGGDQAHFIVGDVCGHDLDAVAVMAQVRHYLHVLAVRAAHPADALEQLDSVMLDHALDRFATVALLSWDASTRTVTHVSAGHPPPLLVRTDGTASFLEGGRRPPINIGMTSGLPAEPATNHLEVGDSLVLYTDGLFEATASGPVDGLEHLRTRAAARAQAPSADALCDQLLADMRPPDGWHDDVALLVARCI